MSEQPTPYNQIDFIVPAPKFRIVFSYMSNQGVSFIREYLLRLLRLTPCTPEQIAQYFGFNQHETEVALQDLACNRWITWQNDGLIALSDEGLRLFQNDAPKIPSLQEYGGDYHMELLDSNFLQQKCCDNIKVQAIELKVENKIRSESTEVAQKAFQNRFRQLLEDDIISSSSIDKDIALYKIDVIEFKHMKYFRFTQQFELLPKTGEPKERHDVPDIIYQDNIQQAITAQIEQYHMGRGSNLRELRESMNELNDNDTLNVLVGGCVDFAEFLKVSGKDDRQKGLYFLGQIYHQEPVFEKINEIIKKLDKKNLKKLYWFAPIDIYWGKQRKIHDKIKNLVDNSKDKYDFRLYLPIRPEHDKQRWTYEFKSISEKVLYGFYEGFLNGNTEILFLEDKFAVVCYHVKLPNYPVTLPIGFMTTKIHEVKNIAQLAQSYLNSTFINEDNEIRPKYLGLLS